MKTPKVKTTYTLEGVKTKAESWCKLAFEKPEQYAPGMAACIDRILLHRSSDSLATLFAYCLASAGPCGLSGEGLLKLAYQRAELNRQVAASKLEVVE